MFNGIYIISNDFIAEERPVHSGLSFLYLFEI